MSRKRRPSLVRQAQIVYQGKLAIGESRHAAKALGTARDKIFSYSTLRTYTRCAAQFVRYCREMHGCRYLEECRPYAAEYFRFREELSPWTVYKDRSALAKLFGCTGPELGPVKRAARAGIRRLRGLPTGFSEEKHRDLVTFARATGLRRRELKAVRGDQLKTSASGVHYLKGIRGKGGRVRNVPVLPECVPEVVRMCAARGAGRVFPRITKDMPVHRYRAEYASSVYSARARDVSALPPGEVYRCRADLEGVRLDREAMQYASRCLGHSRTEVISLSYLYTLKP